MNHPFDISFHLKQMERDNSNLNQDILNVKNNVGLAVDNLLHQEIERKERNETNESQIQQLETNIQKMNAFVLEKKRDFDSSMNFQKEKQIQMNNGVIVQGCYDSFNNVNGNEDTRYEIEFEYIAQQCQQVIQKTRKSFEIMSYHMVECERIESKIVLNGKNVKTIFDNVIVDIDCMIAKLEKLIYTNYYCENSDSSNNMKCFKCEINTNSDNNNDKGNCNYTYTSEYNRNINGMKNIVCKVLDVNCYPCIDEFANNTSCNSISSLHKMKDTDGNNIQYGLKHYDNNGSNSNGNNNFNDDSVYCLIGKSVQFLTCCAISESSVTAKHVIKNEAILVLWYENTISLMEVNVQGWYDDNAYYDDYG